jgi:hypothetical protein
LSQTENCCIFRVNRIHHEESTEAQNKTAQEHYGRKMTMVLGRTRKLSDPKNLMSRLQELEGINICFSHRTNWCSQQWHEGILHNQQIGGGRLENVNPARIDQLIDPDQLVCSAIKLSSSRGIHQCSKQDIRRLSRTENCDIFRVKQTSFHPKKIQWAGLRTWRSMHLLITEKWLLLQTWDLGAPELLFFPSTCRQRWSRIDNGLIEATGVQTEGKLRLYSTRPKVLFFSPNCKHRQSRIKRGWANPIDVKKMALKKNPSDKPFWWRKEPLKHTSFLCVCKPKLRIVVEKKN